MKTTTMTKEEVLEKYLNDNHDAVQTYRDILKSMEEYAEQQSMAFVEWIHNSNIPFYGYRGRDIWEIMKPLKQGEKQEYISTNDLYQLFLTQQNKQP